MCAAMPAQVITIKGDTATVALGGRRLTVGRRLLPKAQPGDWALVHAGQLVSLLPSEDALALQDLLRELSAPS